MGVGRHRRAKSSTDSTEAMQALGALAEQGIERTPALHRDIVVLLQELGDVPERSQRRAEFVRHGRDETGLQARDRNLAADRAPQHIAATSEQHDERGQSAGQQATAAGEFSIDVREPARADCEPPRQPVSPGDRNTVVASSGAAGPFDGAAPPVAMMSAAR